MDEGDDLVDITHGRGWFMDGSACASTRAHCRSARARSADSSISYAGVAGRGTPRGSRASRAVRAPRPRHTWMPCPKREVVRRPAAIDVVLVGDAPTPARRGCPNPRRSSTLSPSVTVRVVQLDVAGQRARHQLCRALVAEDLLDRIGDAVRVGEHLRPLLREALQREQTVAEQLRRGLVARDDQEEEEADDLLVGEVLAVALGRDQRGGEIVGAGIAAGGRPRTRRSTCRAGTRRRCPRA